MLWALRGAGRGRRDHADIIRARRRRRHRNGHAAPRRARRRGAGGGRGSVGAFRGGASRAPSRRRRQGRLGGGAFSDGAFDAVLAQLVVNFLADPETGVAEMRRVARPVRRRCRLRLGLSRRDDAPAGLLGRRGVARPGKRARGRRAHADAVRRARRARRALAGSGLGEVEDGELVVSAEYEGFEDLWEPFTRGVGPRYAASRDPEQQEALKRVQTPPRRARRPLRAERARVVRCRPK